MGRKGLKTRASAPTPEKKKEEELKEEIDVQQQKETDQKREAEIPAMQNMNEETEEEITMTETEEEGTDTPKEEEEKETILPKEKQQSIRRKRRDEGERRWIEALEKLGEVLTKDRPPKAHAHYNTAPLHMDPWSGGRGYKEFKQEFESKSAGSAWSDEMKVTRLAGHLRGLVAARYKEWLEKGLLKGKTMNEVWRMVEKDMVNIEEENELDKEAWEQRLQKNTESVQEFYEVFMTGAARADVHQGRALTSRFVKNLKKDVSVIIRPALTANPELSLATLVQMARQAEGRPNESTLRGRKREWEDFEDVNHVTVNALVKELADVKSRLAASEVETLAMQDHMKERRPQWVDTRPTEGRETHVVMSQMMDQMAKMAKELETLRHGGQQAPTLNRRREASGSRLQGKCYRCDEVGHSSRECTKTLQCSFCHKTGHVEQTCWRRPRATGPRKRSREDGGEQRPAQPITAQGEGEIRRVEL